MASVEHERVDFSPLDPTRDAYRFERIVQSVVARAVRQRERKTLLWRWQLGAFCAAASLAAAVWAPTLLTENDEALPVSAVSEPSLALLTWANREEPPHPAEVLDALGRSR